MYDRVLRSKLTLFKRVLPTWKQLLLSVQRETMVTRWTESGKRCEFIHRPGFLYIVPPRTAERDMITNMDDRPGFKSQERVRRSSWSSGRSWSSIPAPVCSPVSFHASDPMLQTCSQLCGERGNFATDGLSKLKGWVLSPPGGLFFDSRSRSGEITDNNVISNSIAPYYSAAFSFMWFRWLHPMKRCQSWRPTAFHKRRRWPFRETERTVRAYDLSIRTRWGGGMLRDNLSPSAGINVFCLNL